MRISHWLAVAALGLTLAACASPPPPPPPPTIVKVTVAAAKDVNPDETGTAAPVTVRLYQLGATGNFLKSDFFQLYGHEQAVLGADLVASDDVTLAPGTSKEVTIEAKPATTAIGIVVPYRQIDKSVWRQVWTPPAHQTSALTVSVDKLSVSVAPGK